MTDQRSLNHEFLVHFPWLCMQWCWSQICNTRNCRNCVTCDSKWKYWFELLFWWILLGLLIIIVKYYMNLTIIMWHLSNIWHHDQFDLFSWIIIELLNNWSMRRTVVQCVFYFFFENWNNELLYLIVILPGSNYKNLKNFCFCHHILHIDSILLLRVSMGLSVSLNKDLVIW